MTTRTTGCCSPLLAGALLPDRLQRTVRTRSRHRRSEPHGQRRLRRGHERRHRGSAPATRSSRHRPQGRPRAAADALAPAERENLDSLLDAVRLRRAAVPQRRRECPGPLRIPRCSTTATPWSPTAVRTWVPASDLIAHLESCMQARRCGFPPEVRSPLTDSVGQTPVQGTSPRLRALAYAVAALSRSAAVASPDGVRFAVPLLAAAVRSQLYVRPLVPHDHPHPSASVCPSRTSRSAASPQRRREPGRRLDGTAAQFDPRTRRLSRQTRRVDPQ